MRANRIDLNKPKQLQQIAFISHRIKCRQFLPQQQQQQQHRIKCRQSLPQQQHQQQQRRLRKLVENCLIIELNWRAKPVRDALSRFARVYGELSIIFSALFSQFIAMFRNMTATSSGCSRSWEFEA